MEPRSHFGVALVVLGLLIIVSGLVMIYIDRIPYIGRLPGDINIHGKGWSIHFPIVTGIVLSLILTVILNLFFRR